MKLRTGPGEDGRSQTAMDSADRGPIAYLESLVGELMGSPAAAMPNDGIELEAA